MVNKSELVVITKANDLCNYIFKVTQNSPKKYRFSLVSRLENLSLEVVEKLYRANDCFVEKNGNGYEQRVGFQRAALTSLRILATMAFISREQGCILPAGIHIS